MSNNSGYPFTLTQWQELEQQALIYKHMASGIPIPPELLIPIQRSTTTFFPTSHHPFSTHPTTIGWSFPQLGGAGRRAEDPEPGRCRRTDGKKWRCSKEAYPDSKYCERHMHRGKNRSRKPVEISLSSTSTPTTTTTNSTNPSSSSSSHYPYNLMYPHPYQTHNSFMGERGGSWELKPLGLGEPKQREMEEEKEHCFVLGADFKLEKQVKERDFFDGWPEKNKGGGGGSWMGLEGDDHESSTTQGSNAAAAAAAAAAYSNNNKTTQLSISIPMGLHDFLQ